MKIPRIMSTQHPDNVTIPFFAEKSVMEGEDEIKEAFYTFSHLGADEQLWDAEGKEVDAFVVKKLLSRYEPYFRQKILGKDKFITLRVPNPEVEKNEAKILLEALHSLPRNYDLAKAFYENNTPPIFEVAVPMCSSEKSIQRVHEYYKEVIVKSQDKTICDVKLKDWVGELKPLDIKTIPLFETKEAILNSADYVEKYLDYAKIRDYQRVWFARSDPALNYGSTATVLIIKVGLQRLYQLQQKTGIQILPIIGCGSAPFRGNFTPLNAEKMVAGYPSVQTFTIQSAFKYDYPAPQVMQAIERVQNTERGVPLLVDESQVLSLIEKLEREYQHCINQIAPKIALISPYIPARRKRKLHIGLFGYARKQGEISLPRAITFCASLYSLGLPPDALGLSVLEKSDLEQIRTYYKTIDDDMKAALQYVNKNNLDFFGSDIKEKVLQALELFDVEINKEHQAVSSDVLEALKRNDTLALQEHILKAAQIRRFLG
ncbi:phosphoenolpyruvate carboxylase [Candidatus Woesearchaeota archaeon CG_4_10_14_0_2_um_filter_33_13]|nr:MAG: phosphoenolpyruvate carboxylase [Candidatus Woesearchaeota archaeon CG_4_10_14_0_2_um_filter_33_13]